MPPPKPERRFPVPRYLYTLWFSLFPHPLGCNHTDISPSPGGYILGGVWVVSVYGGGVCLNLNLKCVQQQLINAGAGNGFFLIQIN